MLFIIFGNAPFHLCETKVTQDTLYTITGVLSLHKGISVDTGSQAKLPPAEIVEKNPFKIFLSLNCLIFTENSASALFTSFQTFNKEKSVSPD